ncbi:hypothetical protein C5167_015253 [Papaver somniferum]|uniref:Peroxidase n=1 Tax=Papaver somniferum TaxID=3469 RepID=A0A4Y7J8K4_PAPSO|nr:peroxidase 16-like [Papaver somniferum]XP_026460809.1 peroxidase 16-like [Papaver somniferum]RZC56392.1 hypothetical protein C5167_015244 [Papaver somniferum]RZC56394.1 hypothetical protein C5167_015253 [Papaver somniferum]
MTKKMEVLPVLFLTLSCLLSSISAQLQIDYYKDTCPDLESIVRQTVTEKYEQTFVTAPATLRLFFHDCFVQGCDASVILNLPNAEKDHPDDTSLAGDGFDTVIKAKAAVDKDSRCTNKVSCADILAIAARDVVVLTGGPDYPVELGRFDGRISTTASVQNNLPSENFNLDQLTTMFASHGLTLTDLVALSGAHTIGFAHCGRFSKRLYQFNSTHQTDPTLNSTYAQKLMASCPPDVDPRVSIDNDPTSPKIFDNAYYTNLQQGMGLFGSDQTLFTDSRSKAIVDAFAANNTAFFEAFAAAFTKLGRVGIKTGSEGEIRRDCTALNS